MSGVQQKVYAQRSLVEAHPDARESKRTGKCRSTRHGVGCDGYFVIWVFSKQLSPSDDKDDEDTDGGKMQCDDDDEDDEENEQTHTTFTTESGHEVVLSVIIPRSITGTNTTDTVSRMTSDKPQQITSPPSNNTEIIWLPASHPPPPPLYSIKQQLNYSQVGY